MIINAHFCTSIWSFLIKAILQIISLGPTIKTSWKKSGQVWIQMVQWFQKGFITTPHPPMTWCGYQTSSITNHVEPSSDLSCSLGPMLNFVLRWLSILIYNESKAKLDKTNKKIWQKDIKRKFPLFY